MYSLADKIRAKGEIMAAVAELAEEKVKAKAKVLKVKKGLKVGKIKSKK